MVTTQIALTGVGHKRIVKMSITCVPVHANMHWCEILTILSRTTVSLQFHFLLHTEEI